MPEGSCASFPTTASSSRRVRSSFGSSRELSRAARLRRAARRPSRSARRAALSRASRSDRRSDRHRAARAARRFYGAATAGARPRRSTWPPSFRGGSCASAPGLHSEALSVNSSTLTCIGNDYGYDHVFSRQVEAFAQPGDVVDRNDDERNVAQRRARARGGKTRGAVTVAFTGNGGGRSPRSPTSSLDRSRRLRRDRSGGAPSDGAHRLRSRRAGS